jgi:hypothetical protein
MCAMARSNNRSLFIFTNAPWPQAPERTGPRSAAVLVRRMRASTKARGKVSSAAPRPLRCARDPRTRTAALHKVPLSLGRICSSGWHPLVARPTAGLLSFTRRLPRIPCSLRGLENGRHVDNQGLEPVHLAALAGEDRAALSGRPRKANAGQSAGVVPQRNPARNRDATTTTNTNP